MNENQNLDPQKTARTHTALQQNPAIDETRSSLSLNITERSALCLFGVVLIWSIFYAVRLKSLGFHKKSKEALICIAISFALWGSAIAGLALYVRYSILHGQYILR